jgi:cell division protein YceG involved in septum cleavage
MISLFLDKYKFLVLAVFALLIVSAFVYTYHKGYSAGATKCEMEHIQAQIEQDKKVKKVFNEVKRKAPADSDDIGVAEFLLKHVVGQ